MNDLLTAALGGNERKDPNARGAAAVRLRVRLQPAAGVGARLLPPTYSGNDGPVYLREERRVEDEAVPCVILDSQASQSNRLEEALLELKNDDRVKIPDVEVDQQEFGLHSALAFSHRVFDAWVEDALDGDVRFGETDAFERLASVINRGVAKPLLELFPVGLLLGCWASRRHNPQGSTRLARAITSEIIGYGVLDGARASSRVDRHHVSNEVRLAEESDTTQARFEVVDAKDKKGKRPSEFGYGNVTPQAASHGGVTVRFAEQQTVISLAALRSVRADDLRSGEHSSPELNVAARELLVLLAIAMLEAQLEVGWDLRSGCQLIPETEPTLELVGRVGETLASEPLIGFGAVEMLAERTRAAAEKGLSWDVSPISLTASEPQLELLRRSMGLPPAESTEG